MHRVGLVSGSEPISTYLVSLRRVNLPPFLISFPNQFMDQEDQLKLPMDDGMNLEAAPERNWLPSRHTHFAITPPFRHLWTDRVSART